MTKKGFTLAELLGVVIILGTLIIVVITPIVNNINKHKEKLDSAAIELLYNTCETYIDNNKINYRLIEDNIYYITIGNLINSGLMDKEFINTYSNDVLSEYSVIKITVKNNIYNYQLLNNNTYNNIYETSLGLSTNTYSFMSGSYYKDNLSNNYVLYSGMIWRIIGINKDHSIKLLLNEDATSLIPGKINSMYKKSYARDWLNNNFFDLLSNNDIIKKENWCVDETENVNEIKNECTNIINDNVGLMTIFENNNVTDHNIYKNNSNYITITQKKDNPGFYYKINKNGESDSFGQSDNITYIRPVINILPYTSIIKGDGSITNPFVLNKDYSINNSSKKLNNIDLPTGAYINYKSNVYRVMKIEDNNIEMVLNNIVSDAVSSFSTDNDMYNINNGAGYLLNNSKINYFNSNLLEKDCIYNGKYYNQDLSFNNTSLNSKYLVNDSYIGLLKAGDIFSTPIDLNSNLSYWLQTEYDLENSYITGNENPSYSLKTNNNNLRSVIYIKGDSSILSGSGTIENPLIIDS